jgi:hypothetical protein
MLAPKTVFRKMTLAKGINPAGSCNPKREYRSKFGRGGATMIYNWLIHVKESALGFSRDPF